MSEVVAGFGKRPAPMCPVSRTGCCRRLWLGVGLLLLGLVLMPRCGLGQYRDLFRLSVAEQVREFQTYPLARQIDIHLVAMTQLHPPDTRFGGQIARKGREAIPALLRRLKTAQDDRDRFAIMFVFEVMAIAYEPVAADEELVATLRQAVAAMREPFWKAQSEKALEGITTGPSDFFRVPERRERRD